MNSIKTDDSPTIAVGDTVRVKNPDHHISSFAKKVANRDAVVLWVGPIANGQFKDNAKVRFLKRDGRGKEFEEIMPKRDLVLCTTFSQGE